MRQDIDKVLMERGRATKRWRKPNKGYKKRLQYEERISLDTTSRESMARRKDDWYSDYGSRWTIGPIIKFLRQNCGRPWNEVSSELCNALPANKKGRVYARVREFALDQVEEHIQIIDGEVYDSKGYPIRAHSYSENNFYVDQEGILRQAGPSKWRQKYRRKPKPQFKKTDSGEWLIFDKGRSNVWYACEMKSYEMTKTPYRSEMGKHTFFGVKEEFPWDCYDEFFGKGLHFNGRFLQEFYGANVYCVKKRQIGKREIKKYKLRQDSLQAA